MIDHGTYKETDISEGALEKAALELQYFSISFVVNKRLIGSGSLVRINDRHGILTARHVWDAIAGLPGEYVGINLTDHKHCFVVPRPCIHPFVIGGECEVLKGIRIPDLAFLQILDKNIIGSISARKSFYVLDRRKLDPIKGLDLSCLPWFLVGAPGELSKDHGKVDSVDHVLEVVHLAVRVHYSNTVSIKEHDYITVHASTEDRLPSSYQGFSGGGVWITPFSIDPEIGLSSLQNEAPILSGVAFNQSEIRDGERMITAHGTTSLYYRLPIIFTSG